MPLKLPPENYRRASVCTLPVESTKYFNLRASQQRLQEEISFWASLFLFFPFCSGSCLISECFIPIKETFLTHVYNSQLVKNLQFLEFSWRLPRSFNFYFCT